MKSWMVRTAAAALLAAALTTACRRRDSEETSLQAAAERGEELFYKHCSVCHSADTTETIVGPSLRKFFVKPPAPLADGNVLPRTNAAIRELFRKGTKNMPP